MNVSFQAFIGGGDELGGRQLAVDLQSIRDEIAINKWLFGINDIDVELIRAFLTGTRIHTNKNIASTFDIAVTSVVTDSGIPFAYFVGPEGTGTTGSVITARSVAVEGLVTTGGIFDALSVCVESMSAKCAVIIARCVSYKRASSIGSISIATRLNTGHYHNTYD